MTKGLVFKQPDSNVQLLFAYYNDHSNHRIAYYQSTAASSVTLAEAWTNKGCCIFLKNELWSLSAFTAKVQTFLSTHTHIRFIWVVDPTNTSTWVTLSFQGQSGSTAFTSAKTTVDHRNISLSIPAGLTVTRDSDQFRIANVQNGIGLSANSEYTSSW